MFKDKVDRLCREFAENEEREKEEAAKKKEAQAKEMSEKKEADKKEAEAKEKDFSERFAKQFSEHTKGIDDRMCALEKSTAELNEGFGKVLNMCEKMTAKK